MSPTRPELRSASLLSRKSCLSGPSTIMFTRMTSSPRRIRTPERSRLTGSSRGPPRNAAGQPQKPGWASRAASGTNSSGDRREVPRRCLAAAGVRLLQGHDEPAWVRDGGSARPPSGPSRAPSRSAGDRGSRLRPGGEGVIDMAGSNAVVPLRPRPPPMRRLPKARDPRRSGARGAGCREPMRGAGGEIGPSVQPLLDRAQNRGYRAARPCPERSRTAAS